MAVAVVEPFEMVHIQQQQGQRLADHLVPLQFRRQLPVEQQPIAHARQGIAGGQLLEILGAACSRSWIVMCLVWRISRAWGMALCRAMSPRRMPRRMELVDAVHRWRDQEKSVEALHQQLALEPQRQ